MLKSRIVFAFVLIPFAIACQSTTTSTGLSDDGVPIDRCRSDLAAVYASTIQFANSPPMSVDAHPDHYTRRNIAQEAGNSPEKIIYFRCLYPHHNVNTDSGIVDIVLELRANGSIHEVYCSAN